MIFFQVGTRGFGNADALILGMDLTATIESGLGGNGATLGPLGAGTLVTGVRGSATGSQTGAQAGADGFHSRWMEALSNAGAETTGDTNPAADSLGGQVKLLTAPLGKLIPTPAELGVELVPASGVATEAGAGGRTQAELADIASDTLITKEIEESSDDTQSAPASGSTSAITAKKGTGGSKVASLNDDEKPAAAPQALPSDPILIALATPIPVAAQPPNVSTPASEPVAGNWGLNREQHTQTVDTASTVDALVPADGAENSASSMKATLPAGALSKSTGGGSAATLEVGNPGSGDLQELHLKDGTEGGANQARPTDFSSVHGLGSGAVTESILGLKSEMQSDVNPQMPVKLQPTNQGTVQQSVLSDDIKGLSERTTGKETTLSDLGTRLSKGDSTRTSAKAQIASATGPQASMDSAGAYTRDPSLVQPAAGATEMRGTHARESATETFQALDTAGSRGQFTWTRAGAHEAEAGFNDPVLGWVAVRAEPRSGGVQASVLVSSAESASALSGELSGVQAHLAERQISVHSVTVGTDGGTGMAWGGSSGEGSHSREQGQAVPPQIKDNPWSWQGRSSEPAATEADRVAIPAAGSLGRHISVRV